MREGQDPSEPAFLRPQRASAAPEPGAARGARAGVGVILARFGLAVFLGYFGALKFSVAEAHAIQPLVENSPTLAWLYPLLGVVDAARIIGAVELAAALLLVASPISAAFGLAGSLLAVATFTTTLSFLATTPGTFIAIPRFPLPAPSPTAAFILKDVFLLGLALWSVVQATRALRPRAAS